MSACARRKGTAFWHAAHAPDKYGEKVLEERQRCRTVLYAFCVLGCSSRGLKGGVCLDKVEALLLTGGGLTD